MFNETGPEFSPYAAPAMMLWAGMFAVLMMTCGSMIAFSQPLKR